MPPDGLGCRPFGPERNRAAGYATDTARGTGKRMRSPEVAAWIFPVIWKRSPAWMGDAVSREVGTLVVPP